MFSTYILFVLMLILLIFNLSIYSALNKLFRFRKKSKGSNINISIVVAAKNETEIIPNLIAALLKQNFPKDNFEVIIVDDNSEDDTFLKAKSICTELENFRIIKTENKIFKAKKGALDLGIKLTKYPYILITDADCEPEVEWINSFASGFANKNDFLFGIAPYKRKNSLTNLVARFENLRASIIVFAFSKLGFPYSAAARSFGFSKEAFNKINGYENTNATLSGDDDLLLQEAIKFNFKIGMVTENNSFVFSNTKNNFTDFSNQKARHTSTSIYYSFKSKLLLAIWHLINLTSLFSILALPYGNIFLLPFFIKIIIDTFVLNNFQNNFGYKINPILFIFLQINYELNLIYFFLKGLKFPNRWD